MRKFFVFLFVLLFCISAYSSDISKLTFSTAKEEDYCKVPTKKVGDEEKTEAASPETCFECLAKTKKKSLKDSSKKILAKTQSREQKIEEILALQELNQVSQSNPQTLIESYLQTLTYYKSTNFPANQRFSFLLSLTTFFLCPNGKPNVILEDVDCPSLLSTTDNIKSKTGSSLGSQNEISNETQSDINNLSEKIEKYLKEKHDTIQKTDNHQQDRTELDKLSESELDKKYDIALLGSNCHHTAATKCGMSRVESCLLISYTGSLFQKLNSDLRMKSNKYKYVEKILNAALGKFKDQKIKVKRVMMASAEVLNQHKKGQVITYEAFTSTSKRGEWGEHADEFMPNALLLTIRSKHGKYIAPISEFQMEEEVLFKSKTKFKIISKEGNEVIMEEVD